MFRYHSNRTASRSMGPKLLLAIALICAGRGVQAAPLPEIGGTPLMMRAAARPDSNSAAVATDEQPPPDDRPIDQMQANVRVSGEVPTSAALKYFPDKAELGTWSGRGWSQSCYHWEASALYHQPLYFEDVPLERYGHALPPPFQPLLSGAKFFATIPFMTYKMVLEPPIEPIYALGYYRPGSPAPWLWYPVPIRYDATAVQAGLVLGLIFVLPFP